MTLWKKIDGWGNEPLPGSDREYSKTFVLTDGEAKVETTVEFEATSVNAGPKEAERIIKRYLDAPRPPRRVLVRRDGSVSVDDE